ncbi:Uma2 family endonuclease [Planosporangium sp. 12N6]|uniref:Uma2 family endonuclease n=1 Tax=Planosporangium spinosum TaxID=3402278 RepID=UPI003CED3852
MTVTESLRPPTAGWTVDDLYRLPDTGVRYELFDGSLLVTPAPALRHVRAVNRLRDLLSARAPHDIAVVQDAGVTIHGRRTYFIPDICVVRTVALDKDADQLDQDDVLLAVEVLSPSNPGNDLVLKRHYYAAGGIPQYWVVDPDARRLTVLTLDGDTYAEQAVVEPGQVWRSAEPFDLSVDPADVV